MCGIAGFTEFSNSFGGEKSLALMGETLTHRGPDAAGVYYQKPVGLCHRRLSIIDLSPSGNQPMQSQDGRYLITFNGEIYNYRELRKQLKSEGYRFASHSDTEVILGLYARDGEGFLDKINGMFALAIWDKQTETLFLARDRIGKKPLYYYRKDNDVVFASELKALFTLEHLPRKIRLDALYDYFAYQYVPDPKTILQDFYKLEPGYYLEVNRDGLSKKQYWDIRFAAPSSTSKSKLVGQLREIIKQSTVDRMISDVPLGAFLSGGVDSSGIVATMAKNCDTPITTCSIGFDEEQFNETEFSKIVSTQYRTDHHEFTVHENVEAQLAEIVAYFDEPFADPSLVPTYFVSRLARQKVTVAISGDGGDEVFAGYEKYSIDHFENVLRNMIPEFIRTRLFPILEALLSKFNLRFCRRGITLLGSLRQDPAMGFYLSNAQMTDKIWNRIVSDETRTALGDYHPSTLTIENYHRCPARDHLAKILYTDMKTYLPGDILVKVDRMSMANSLEVRAPLLDYRLIEFAATIPSELKLYQGEKKYILKEALKGDLPDEILRRKKMGFSVPLAQWLRNELREFAEKLLFKSSSGLGNFFDMGSIQQIWREHITLKNDHSSVLWSFLMFQIWWNEYMENSS